MDEAQLLAMVVGAVFTLRRAVPKVDGLLVVLAALAFAGAVAFAYSPGTPLDVLRHAVRLGLAAIGAVFIAGRVGRNAPDPKGAEQ